METLEVFYILNFLDPHVSESEGFAGSGINFSNPLVDIRWV
jgi:hypothetical protein